MKIIIVSIIKSMTNLFIWLTGTTLLLRNLCSNSIQMIVNFWKAVVNMFHKLDKLRAILKVNSIP